MDPPLGISFFGVGARLPHRDEWPAAVGERQNPWPRQSTLSTLSLPWKAPSFPNKKPMIKQTLTEKHTNNNGITNNEVSPTRDEAILGAGPGIHDGQLRLAATAFENLGGPRPWTLDDLISRDAICCHAKNGHLLCPAPLILAPPG